ncbi:MAG: hypothetical protein ACRDOK_04175 [Streptosporangiaceae bacterium]
MRSAGTGRFLGYGNTGHRVPTAEVTIGTAQPAVETCKALSERARVHRLASWSWPQQGFDGAALVGSGRAGPGPPRAGSRTRNLARFTWSPRT